ncbi:uncharacterized protein [Arachis hypogaea]|uniref:Uncharacterized protein n=1 Tax=Arachis hypogaea TaxID=3818 RepID=A0A445BRQ4_ARAHY|nr:epidermal growth factor receptor substrate 15 isoform X1 [Arachis hypogaea]QHO29488.1 putative calcium-binding protein.10c [Arachis hypogaea]RYR41364.1 hypothetical protein Ahy_A08g037763 isoform B [Arachis hypogaea]
MAAPPNMDQFEAYFRRADLDGDGRISGAEAVSFFMGSNLPKPVLAQVWNYADQAKTGFLGRNEFYNALRLVTVAQSKRDLTPDIVKAALYGPAAAKIPAPQINLAALPPPRQNAVAPAASMPQMGVTALRPNAVAPAVSMPQMGVTAPRPNSVAPAASMPQMGVTAPHPNSISPAASMTMGVTAPTSTQGFAYRGQGFPGPAANQQYFPSQLGPTMRQPQSMPATSAPRPQQGVVGPDISKGVSVAGHNLSNPSISSGWNSGGPGTVAARPGGLAPSLPLSTSAPPLAPVSPMSQPTTVNTRALSVSGNGFSSNSVLGNDLFSTTSSTLKQEPAGQSFSFSSSPASSAIVPVSSGAQPATKKNALDSLQSAFSMQPVGSQFQRGQSASHPSQQISPPASASHPSQQISPPASSPHASSGISAGLGNTNSDNSQQSWPKMKPSDVQKYTRVFMEVDTDRDGKITGEQARSLFLSWRLPIDVLKKVWDLSDQDNDSMLSLKEFCYALYLMERYREGHSLPPTLPHNVMFDETLLSMLGHPKIPHGGAAWGIRPGFQQQQGTPGARPVAPIAGLRPPVQGTSVQVSGNMLPNQQKSGAPVLEDSFMNRTNNGEQHMPKPQDATTTEKAEEAENVILDSKEKLEYYRNKMQELVLYKSRCDNRLNEITERASADKREAELLSKKYEEKYKQVAEIASKLTVEEAKFRDIQERKVELQQAIVKMEQGGSADGILQVRADRIQSDLEELFKALAERCKKHGIDVKSIAMVQLPTGWQPGIAEGAALWDEDWDKFEDEGFANDLTFAKHASPKSKPTFVKGEQNFPDDNSAYGSPVNANGKQETAINGDYAVEDKSYTHSEDGFARSPRGSPAGRTTVEDSPFVKSPRGDAETRSFDESTWGAFDNNDDVDSVWNFPGTKDSDGDFFKSGDFGINPIRTGSTHADGMFQAKSPFTFDDSVPATPLSKFSNSPRYKNSTFDDSVPATPLSKFGNSPRYSEAGDFFETSRFDSRFDSFSMHDGGFSPQPEGFTRFDSFSSSKDFGYSSENFTRSDSMSSNRDFGLNNDKFARFDSISSSRDVGFNNDKFSRFDSISSSSQDFGYHPETFTRFDSMSSSSKDFGHARFDSISSTKDLGHSSAFSFDDTDPFGSSGPFKVSSDTNSSKKGSDNWSAF